MDNLIPVIGSEELIVSDIPPTDISAYLGQCPLAESIDPLTCRCIYRIWPG